MFISNEAFVSHLMGKRHMKLSKEDPPVNDPEEEERIRKEFVDYNENRRKNIAFLEFRVSRLREELASVLYDTMNLVRKKQTQRYEDIEEVES